MSTVQDDVRAVANRLQRAMEFAEECGGVEQALTWLELLREYQRADQEMEAGGGQPAAAVV